MGAPQLNAAVRPFFAAPVAGSMALPRGSARRHACGPLGRGSVI
jgi:hypothetical protein